MPASGLANAQAVYQMTQQVSMMIGMAVLLAVANRSGNLADPISYRPSWATQSGVYVLVNLLVASLPDVAYALHSKWESLNSCATDPDAGCSPMVTAALDFFRHRLPVFRAGLEGWILCRMGGEGLRVAVRCD